MGWKLADRAKASDFEKKGNYSVWQRRTGEGVQERE